MGLPLHGPPSCVRTARWGKYAASRLLALVHDVGRNFVRNISLEARAFWTLLRTERATPREVALAVFVGAWIGCSPALFVRTWLAVGIATLAKMNRLWAFVGAHLTANLVSAAWIVLAEVQVSHRLRQGEWLTLNRHEVSAHGFALLGDWLLGFVVVGPVISGVLALATWAIAEALRRRTKTEAAV
jgi:uncharacterized protein (DUF2062 family)